MGSLFETGTVVQDRYELRGELGRGGFAKVFRAYDRRLRREVAIKILEGLEASRSQDRYQRLLERFEAEAVASSRLDHPGIITVHDSGVVGDPPQPFMVMELLKGHDLDEELRTQGPMTPARAWPLVLGALDALGAAHQQGVVHKDLKPSNLFLLEPGTRKERLKVVDFGIAHICEQDERLTGAGQLLGTPQYLAPEYIEDHTVTPALDVYQVGLILVELLTGEPVVGGNPMRCVVRHSKGDLSIPPELEGALGPVLRRALHRDHTQRFTDAWALMEALEAVDPASVPDLSRRRGQSQRSPSQAMDSQVQFGAPSTLDSAELDKFSPRQNLADQEQGEDASGLGVPPEVALSASRAEPAPIRMLGTPSPRRGRPRLAPAPAPARHAGSRRASPIWAVAALVALVLAGVALAVASWSRPAPEPKHIMGATPAREDTEADDPGPALGDQVVTLDAEPAAQVFRGGRALGSTPHIMFRPGGEDVTEVTLRREGFQDQEVALRWAQLKSGAVRAYRLQPVGSGAAPTPGQVPVLGQAREPLLVTGQLVVEGPRGPDALRQGLEERRADILSCYSKRLTQQEALGGDLKLLFSVSGQGAVTYARVQPGSLRDVELEGCLVGLARGWSFAGQPDAGGDGPTSVSYPLVFSSRAAQ